MAEADPRRARVERLLEAARRLADGASDAGQALRAHLLETTDLSAPGIELGISRCLETRPSPGEIAALLASTPEAPGSHVLLSANVFVAALRAIAIGVAASEQVFVRASRRDPALAHALHAIVPELFQLVTELEPRPGDHFWSYGSDETLDSLRPSLPAGVWFHRHGYGVGAVVLQADGLDVEAATRAIALDTAVFDQRGCLSPRAVCVLGSAEQTTEIARALARELIALERAVPKGPRGADELAEARRLTDMARYAFELFEAGSGWVCVGNDDQVVFPPAERCLHVLRVSAPVQVLAPWASHLTCIGASVSPPLTAALRRALPGARLVAPGEMQRPPLDGPVDLRHGTRGEQIA